MDKKAKILIKLASRSRPEKFLACLDNIFNKIADKENYLILVSADSDDTSMYNKYIVNEVRNRVQKGYKISFRIGVSKNKIDAINRDIEECNDWQILINTSDDMTFEKIGFDEVIRHHFSIHFPDYDGCMHYNDGYAKDKVCTMSIIGIKWYNRFHYVYHRSYASLWCDNEHTEYARSLNRIQYYADILFLHNHPVNTGGMIDAQLIKTESYNSADYENYLKRKKQGFKIN